MLVCFWLGLGWGLVAEYYVLRGFVVYCDIPLGSGSRGGRRDIDVVVVDMEKGEIVIVDVKASWIGTPENVARDIAGRLSEAVSRLSQWYGDRYRYIKRAIIFDLSENKVRRIAEILGPMGIEVQSHRELISEILDYIDAWCNKEASRRGLVKEGIRAALPETLYLLKLLEYMQDSGLVRAKGG